MEILRGDIFHIRSYDNNQGSEQESGRPAVIVSNNKCNAYSNVVEIVYLTTKEKKPLPTHVPVVCQQPSTALCEAVYSVTVDRIGDFIKAVTDAELEAINKALKISLALEDDSETETDIYEKQAMEAHIELLEGDLAKSEAIRKKLVIELDEAKKAAEGKTPDRNATTANMKIASLEAERNTYKDMYEKLLHKLLEK